jgi:hypothetical protein
MGRVSDTREEAPDHPRGRADVPESTARDDLAKLRGNNNGRQIGERKVISYLLQASVAIEQLEAVPSCRVATTLNILFRIRIFCPPWSSRNHATEIRSTCSSWIESRLWGAKMMINIDLDSWELGYADGQFGRLSQCPANLDSFSYSSGYCEGRACHAGTDRNQSARRRASSFHR